MYMFFSDVLCAIIDLVNCKVGSSCADGVWYKLTSLSLLQVEWWPCNSSPSLALTHLLVPQHSSQNLQQIVIIWLL